MRDLLLNDTDSNVRRATASVLGRRSSHPDWALFTALRLDSNSSVKRAALGSILRLAGISFRRVTQELKRIKSEGIQLTEDEVKRIFADFGIDIPGYSDKSADMRK